MQVGIWAKEGEASRQKRRSRPARACWSHAVVTSLTKPFYLHVIFVFVIYSPQPSSREPFGNTLPSCIHLDLLTTPCQQIWINVPFWSQILNKKKALQNLELPPFVIELICPLLLSSSPFHFPHALKIKERLYDTLSWLFILPNPILLL